jgi:hypothetical protein
MKITDHVTGPFCNDLAIMVISERWPHLTHGREYMVGHPVDEKQEPVGPPFFMRWSVPDIELPDMNELASVFAADEARYRAALARYYRARMLAWSDSKVQFPVDAPLSLTKANTPWLLWRQALRDLPQQPGFPFEIAWPECPDQEP